MAALWWAFRGSDKRVLAGKRLIDLPIPDTQHENPRGVDKGRLLTRYSLLLFPKRAIQIVMSGRAPKHRVIADLRALGPHWKGAPCRAA